MMVPFVAVHEFSCWHEADIASGSADVCFWENSGRQLAPCSGVCKLNSLMPIKIFPANRNFFPVNLHRELP